jgi:hypothetical protein
VCFFLIFLGLLLLSVEDVSDLWGLGVLPPIFSKGGWLEKIFPLLRTDTSSLSSIALYRSSKNSLSISFASPSHDFPKVLLSLLRRLLLLLMLMMMVVMMLLMLLLLLCCFFLSTNSCVYLQAFVITHV